MSMPTKGAVTLRSSIFTALLVWAPFCLLSIYSLKSSWCGRGYTNISHRAAFVVDILYIQVWVGLWFGVATTTRPLWAVGEAAACCDSGDAATAVLTIGGCWAATVSKVAGLTSRPAAPEGAGARRPDWVTRMPPEVEGATPARGGEGRPLTEEVGAGTPLVGNPTAKRIRF